MDRRRLLDYWVSITLMQLAVCQPLQAAMSTNCSSTHGVGVGVNASQSIQTLLISSPCTSSDGVAIPTPGVKMSAGPDGKNTEVIVIGCAVGGSLLLIVLLSSAVLICAIKLTRRRRRAPVYLGNARHLGTGNGE